MILDLDGTLCNDTWRKRCLPDYDQYHSGIPDDLPNPALFWLMELFMDGGHDMGLGILTSLFSSVFVSRALVNLIYGRKRKLESLSIGQIWKPDTAAGKAK